LARLGFEGRGASQVAIHSYQIDQVPGIGPVYVEFRDQPTSPILGDIFTDSFPLFNASGPNAFHQYNPPLMITEGDNQWNGSHRLIISVFDNNHDALIFTSLVILLTYVEVDPCDPKRGDVNEVKRISAKQTVGRNVFPLPRAFEPVSIDSELKTSLPYHY
jgi:hypothetical protein